MIAVCVVENAACVVENAACVVGNAACEEAIVVDVVEEVEVQVLKSMMNHKSKNVVVAAEALVEVLEDLIWPTTLLPQEDVEMAVTEKDASTIERAVSEEPLHKCSSTAKS